MIARPTLLLLALVPPLTAPSGPPLGEEAFGNAPVEANEQWAPGVLAVANDEHRVYRRWVNGDEEFCFRGDAPAVNSALAAYARIEADVAEVVLLPTPGLTRSFEGQEVRYDWRLFAPSGLLLAMTRRAGQASAYRPYATLTVHFDGKGFALGDLELPAGVRLLGPDDLVRRYVRALGAPGAFERATAVSFLGQLDYLPEAIEALAGALDDEAVSVRVTAARALGRAGARGRSALPRLRARVERAANETERAELGRAIEAIEGAAEPERPDAAFDGRLQHLRDLLGGRRVELEVRQEEDERGRMRFAATLVNRGTLPALVVKPGDGSDVGWRQPHVRWEVRDAATGELFERPDVPGCGIIDAVSVDEFVALRPGDRCELDRWVRPPYLPPGARYSLVLRYDNDPGAVRGALFSGQSAAVRHLLRRSTPLSLSSAPLQVTVH
jgi:hypothetical protein